jgi:hypothetical protein
MASAALEPIFAVIAAAGARSVAHCCAADIPIALLRGAGAGGVSLDLGVLAAEGYDALGTALDEGAQVHLGLVPSVEPASGAADERQVADRVLRLLDMIGFDPDEVADQLVLTPTCGLAGATPAYTRTALALVRTSAALLVSG